MSKIKTEQQATEELTHEQVIQMINDSFGSLRKGCKFIDEKDLAGELDMLSQNVKRFLRGQRPIPDSCLALFGLERVKHEDTYRKVSK